mgnify:FL=1
MAHNSKSISVEEFTSHSFTALHTQSGSRVLEATETVSYLNLTGSGDDPYSEYPTDATCEWLIRGMKSINIFIQHLLH